MRACARYAAAHPSDVRTLVAALGLICDTLDGQPEHWDSQFLLAETAERDGFTLGAVAVYAALAERVPTSAAARRLAALRSGHGAALLDSPAAPSVDEVSLQLEEAAFFAQQGLHDAAREILEGLKETDPGNLLVAEHIAALERLEPGANVAPTVWPSTLSPNSPIEEYQTHYDLGIAYSEMGLHDDAIAELEPLVTTFAPVGALKHLGRAYLTTGHAAKAVSCFKRALYVEDLRDSDELEVLFALGEAYERLHDPLEALYYYERLAKKSAGYPGLAARLRRLRRR